MTRLDKELHSRSLAKSRTAACDLITDGKVTVNGEKCVKPSTLVGEEDIIAVVGERPRYVSRGGIKLEHALKTFDVDLSGKVCLDVGASTGGFTDCMLRHGAKKVYAVDVGTSQLSTELSDLVNSGRIISLENCDIRSFVPPEKTDFTAVDVSFISLRIILPYLKSLKNMSVNGEIITLIKPQFELGKSHKGVITDRKTADKIADEIKTFAEKSGFSVTGFTESPVTGKSGNREFLMQLKVDS